MSALQPDILASLVAAAQTAKEQSYSPYSRFRVGCALLTASGRTFTGCNVENASYGLAICAERTAFVKAVSEGERTFTAVVVNTDDENLVSPCGACRQFMSEFGLDTEIIMARSATDYVVKKMGDLLPDAFTPAILHNRQL